MRVVAAVAGGYAVASLITSALAELLYMRRSEAVLTATLLSFSIYAAAVIGVFAARTTARAWVGVILFMVFVATALFVRRWIA